MTAVVVDQAESAGLSTGTSSGQERTSPGQAARRREQAGKFWHCRVHAM